jgi:hypothetical protein
VTFPPVFDGIGALVVSSALDPRALASKLAPATTWIAPKLTGADTGGDPEVAHCISVWRGLGLKVGGWIYCDGPPDADIASVVRWTPLDFVIYDVEQPYKDDEGGHYEWAAQLVTYHAEHLAPTPAAVTSYGGYKASIDFGCFARAGWPILAQVYDAFSPGDELTYTTARGGPYFAAGVHQLTRSLALSPGQAVYRPESLDAQ